MDSDRISEHLVTVCGKSAGQSYGWKLGCGLNEGQIVGAHIIYDADAVSAVAETYSMEGDRDLLPTPFPENLFFPQEEKDTPEETVKNREEGNEPEETEGADGAEESEQETESPTEQKKENSDYGAGSEKGEETENSEETEKEEETEKIETLEKTEEQAEESEENVDRAEAST